MNIYFACSITGGREDEGVYQLLVKELLDQGFDVPTAHIAETGIEALDAAEDPADIFHRDVRWIKGSDLLVAEVSTPSHGVGFEIGYALALDKPVLCLHHDRAAVSKMITGNPHPKLQIFRYRDDQEAVRLLREALSSV